MTEPLAIAAIGAGRVFQRLYLPALSFTSGMRLAAVCDLSPAALASVPAGVPVFDRLDGMLDRRLDGILVLSPGPLHPEHAAAALALGIPILLEKPSASSLSQLDSWPWRKLVTLARPRRYWRQYLALRQSLQPGVPLRLELTTSPASWGASTADSVVDDLLPHVHDLAGWLTRSDVLSVEGACNADRATGAFRMSDGCCVEFEVSHGADYRESAAARDLSVDLAHPSIRDRATGRLSGRPPRDIEGVARMLRLWERRLRGENPPGLPGFELARDEVRIRSELA